MKRFLLLFLLLSNLTNGVYSQGTILRQFGKSPIAAGTDPDTTEYELQRATDGGLYSVRKGKPSNLLNVPPLSSTAAFATATADKVIHPKGGTFLKRYGSMPSVGQNAIFYAGPLGTYYALDFSGPVSVSRFNAALDGTTNDVTALKNALSAAAVLNFPITWEGVLNIDTEALSEKRILIPDNVTIAGVSRNRTRIKLSISCKLTPGNFCTIDRIGFTGQGTAANLEAIKTREDVATTDVVISNCSFDDSFQRGIHVSSVVSNTWHRDGVVEKCYFKDVQFSLLFIRGEGFKVRNNYVETSHANARSLCFFGGRNNEVASNTVKGGISGISFIYQRSSAGYVGVIFGNNVHDNLIYNVTEESISFDSRVNEADGTAVRERFLVESKSISGSTYRIHAPGTWTSAPSYFGNYVVFMTGALKGFPIRVIQHAAGSNVFTLELTADKYALITTADMVALGSPMFNNVVHNNTMESPTQTVALWFYGFCFQNVASNNKIRYTGTGVQRYTAVPLAGIAVTSVLGVNPAGSVMGNRTALCDNNKIVNNDVQGLDIRSDVMWWSGNPVKYNGSGNVFSGNTTDKKFDILYQNDLPIDKNSALMGTYRQGVLLGNRDYISPQQSKIDSLQLVISALKVQVKTIDSLKLRAITPQVTGNLRILPGGDVYVTDSTKGIVFRKPDGTGCYRFQVSNSGTGVWTPMPCPPKVVP